MHVQCSTMHVQLFPLNRVRRIDCVSLVQYGNCNCMAASCRTVEAYAPDNSNLQQVVARRCYHFFSSGRCTPMLMTFISMSVYLSTILPYVHDSTVCETAESYSRICCTWLHGACAREVLAWKTRQNFCHTLRGRYRLHRPPSTVCWNSNRTLSHFNARGCTAHEQIFLRDPTCNALTGRLSWSLSRRLSKSFCRRLSFCVSLGQAYSSRLC